VDRAGAPGAPLQVAVLGISLSATCGVRDHAGLLAEALASEHVSCSLNWLLRKERSLRGSREEIRAWTDRVVGELAERRPDAILLHYSVFTFSHKGVPIFVRPVLSALRASGIPVVSVLHEFAYPWGYGGWRGVVWALTQRAVMIEVMRASRAAIVTAESRASWLTSRAWLPRRRVVFAPVYSNLPPSAASPPGDREIPVIGLFGYAYQGAAVAMILDAIGELREQGLAVSLSLLGAPGASSAGGESWVAQARSRGLRDVVSFSGALPAQELSDALASCDVLLFADIAGPSPRKGTLAGSLASGRPVVAIDGPSTWPELGRAQAISLAQPTSAALAGKIAALLGDDDYREALGARTRAFSEREMGVARTASAARELLVDAVGARRP
jgi:glycosyltransferase involved in cell wall biosynthesis